MLESSVMRVPFDSLTCREEKAYEIVKHSVFLGQMTVRYGVEEYTVKENESIRFNADVQHSYHNSSLSTLKITNIIFSP